MNLGTRKIAPWKTAPRKIAPTLTLTIILSLTQEGICRGQLSGGQFQGGGGAVEGQISSHDESDLISQ